MSTIKYDCYGASVMEVLRCLQEIVDKNPDIDFERVGIECNEYSCGTPVYICAGYNDDIHPQVHI